MINVASNEERRHLIRVALGGRHADAPDMTRYSDVQLESIYHGVTSGLVIIRADSKPPAFGFSTEPKDTPFSLLQLEIRRAAEHLKETEH